jgi:hypothetical protein
MNTSGMQEPAVATIIMIGGLSRLRLVIMHLGNIVHACMGGETGLPFGRSSREGPQMIRPSPFRP